MPPPALALTAALASLPRCAASRSWRSQRPGAAGRAARAAAAATGLPIPLRGAGAAPNERVRHRDAGSTGAGGRSPPLGPTPAGRFAATVRPRRPRAPLPSCAPRSPRRAVEAGSPSAPRPVLLAAVGDINLGDGPGAADRRSSARAIRGRVRRARCARADVAFGNLECAVSTRGAPVPKQFNFRGRPAALRRWPRFAGFDVLNLANNHTGDYGTQALLDTVEQRAPLRHAGRSAPAAASPRPREPRVVERLGPEDRLRRLLQHPARRRSTPGPTSAGTAAGHARADRAGVREARRRGRTWSSPPSTGASSARTAEDGRQRAFAQTALAAGADAVIGAHPHVLQPIERRSGRRAGGLQPRQLRLRCLFVGHDARPGSCA